MRISDWSSDVCSSDLIIANAPHPFLFQKTLFDDPTQRAASQYIRAFRNPDLEQHIDQIGLSAFFDTSFAPHTDATHVATEKPVYLDHAGQPGAMTATLHWYRASAIDVHETGAAADRPAVSEAPSPPGHQPTPADGGSA